MELAGGPITAPGMGGIGQGVDSSPGKPMARQSSARGAQSGLPLPQHLPSHRAPGSLG